MRENHHLLHWIHDEAVAVTHWCNVHILHDRHFWIGLLMLFAIALIILLVATAKSGIPMNHDLQYYAYPYRM